MTVYYNKVSISEGCTAFSLGFWNVWQGITTTVLYSGRAILPPKLKDSYSVYLWDHLLKVVSPILLLYWPLIAVGPLDPSYLPSYGHQPDKKICISFEKTHYTHRLYKIWYSCGTDQKMYMIFWYMAPSHNGRVSAGVSSIVKFEPDCRVSHTRRW